MCFIFYLFLILLILINSFNNKSSITKYSKFFAIDQSLQSELTTTGMKDFFKT